MAASSSASAFSGDQKTDFWVTKRHPSVRSRPLVSSVEDGFISSVRWIFPGTKRNPIGDDFSVSGRTGSVSSRLDREREVGSSFTAIGLGSSISGPAQEEGSNRKSKSKLSWFDNEENEENECTTPKAEQFRIPPPRVCPPAPKPKGRSSFFTGKANGQQLISFSLELHD